MVNDRRVTVALLLSVLSACSGSAQNTPPATTAPGPGSTVETTASPATTAATAAPDTTAPATTTPAATNPTPAAPATTATTTDAPLPAMPTGLQGPPQAWAQMNHEARAHWMGQSSMPAMSALFREYNPERYAHVTCATCHGENARAVNFHMPNNLPRLPAPGGPGWQHMMTGHPRLFHFMAERVEPAQAQLLGVEPFNMQTGHGFGCFNCHPHEGT